jgi:hypothetical protein
MTAPKLPPCIHGNMFATNGNSTVVCKEDVGLFGDTSGRMRKPFLHKIKPNPACPEHPFC